MNTQRVDRRVQRTKKLLSKALLELCLEKPYDKITVQDILDRGNFGRSTFYSHFQDKDDLLLSQFDEEGFMIIEHGQSNAQKGTSTLPSLSTIELFKHAKKNVQFYKSLLGGRGIELVHNAGYDKLRENFSKRVALHFPDEEAESILKHLISSYLAGALLHLVIWFIEADMPCSPKQMDEIFQLLAVPGIKGLLESEATYFSQ